MSALVRYVLTLVALVTLSACSSPIIQSAVVPVPTFFPVPTRSSVLATPTAEACALTGTLKLGAVVSLTGPASSYGVSIRRGIDLAVDEINAAQGITPDANLEIVFEDDGTNPEKAAAAFTRLIQEEQVLGLIGPTLSSAAFVADPIAQEAGMPVMGTSNTAEGITEIGSYIFRSSLPESSVIPNTLGAVRSATGASTVVLVYDQMDAFTHSGYSTMSRAAVEQGMTILGEAAFDTGARTFDAEIELIRSREPDLIMVSALIDEASSFLGQLRAEGISTTVMGGNGFNSANLVVYTAQAANGAISGAAWSLDNDYPENRLFVDAFQERYGSDPDQFAAQSYTGVHLFARALRQACSTTHSDIRNALASLRLVPTPLGSFSFTADRNPLHPPVVLVFADGKQVLYTE